MFNSISWNVFRLTGDFLHLGGMILGLLAVYGAGSVECFSRKTQVLFQAVYVTRYLDVFTTSQSLYLLFFKGTFNLITVLMLLAFQRMWSTYDAMADSCNLMAILIPGAIVTHVTARKAGWVEEFWTFSEFLEPFALVPQYIVCYKASRVRPAAILYVLAVGGYRVLYAMNWIYKRYKLHAAYTDYVSWCGGALECVLWLDFVVRISQRKDVIGAFGASPLGRLVLSVDGTAGRIAEKIEMNTIGRRLPFGLSGLGAQDEEREKKQWDVSDKISDEESCQLLTLSGDVDNYI